MGKSDDKDHIHNMGERAGAQFKEAGAIGKLTSSTEYRGQRPFGESDAAYAERKEAWDKGFANGLKDKK